MRKLLLAVVALVLFASVADADHRRTRARSRVRHTTRHVAQVAAAPVRVTVAVASAPVKVAKRAVQKTDGPQCDATGCRAK